MVKAKLATVVALFTLIALTIGLSGCRASDPVAATVNGEKIFERTITTRIMYIRNGNASFADDATWATALNYSNLTPATLREEVINSEAESIIIRLIAKENGVTVDKAAIDAKVSQTKTTVGGDEKTWENALKRFGFGSEADYRSSLEIKSLQEQLMEAIILEPTQEELDELLSSNLYYFQGKRSSAIQLLPSPDLTETEIDRIAAEVAQALTAGTDFATLAAEYSTVPGAAENGGDMGWDSIDVLDVAYKHELDTLAVGELSAPLLGDDGIIYIIYVTDEFTLNESNMLTSNPEQYDLSDDDLYTGQSNTVDLSTVTVPVEILDFFKEYWLATNQSEKFHEMIDQKLEEAKVVINPMPKGLAYDVDMSLATPIEDTDTSDYSTSQPAAVQAAIDAGLEIKDISAGAGTEAMPGSTVQVFYTGTLEDGTVFDSTDKTGQPFTFVLGTGGVIKGWDAGVVGMKVGGTRTLVIPSSLAYGSSGAGSIPADATLMFEVQLVEIVGHNH